MQGYWQVQLTVGRVRNGPAKEDGHWGLNLGTAAIEREGHEDLRGKERRPQGFEGKREGHEDLRGVKGEGHEVLRGKERATRI